MRLIKIFYFSFHRRCAAWLLGMALLSEKTQRVSSHRSLSSLPGCKACQLHIGQGANRGRFLCLAATFPEDTLPKEYQPTLFSKLNARMERIKCERIGCSGKDGILALQSNVSKNEKQAAAKRRTDSHKRAAATELHFLVRQLQQVLQEVLLGHTNWSLPAGCLDATWNIQTSKHPIQRTRSRFRARWHRETCHSQAHFAKTGRWGPDELLGAVRQFYTLEILDDIGGKECFQHTLAIAASSNPGWDCVWKHCRPERLPSDRSYPSQRTDQARIVCNDEDLEAELLEARALSYLEVWYRPLLENLQGEIFYCSLKLVHFLTNFANTFIKCRLIEEMSSVFLLFNWVWLANSWKYRIFHVKLLKIKIIILFKMKALFLKLKFRMQFQFWHDIMHDIM